MKVLKRLFIVCLVSLMVFCNVVSNVEAMSYKTPSSAFKAELNKTYTRVWNESNQNSNFYNKVYVDSNGELIIRVSKPVNEDGDYEGIEIDVYDSNLNTIFKHHTYEAMYDLSKDYYEYRIGVDQGVYYINILFSGFTYIYDTTISSTYKFSFEKNNYVEIESNETYNQATYMNLGHMYNGYLGSYGDDVENDYYKFDVKTKGTYKIVFGNYIAFNETTVLYDLLDANMEDATKYGMYFDIEYDKAFKNYTYTITLDKGTYYLNIWNYHGEPIPYKVGVYNMTCFNKGHQLSSIKQTVAPTLTKNGTGIQTCSRCNHNKIVSIPRKCQFSDVTGDKWYFDTVVEASQLGLMTGATDTLFKPNASMNRAMVACVFHRMEGSKKTEYKALFKDVANGHYYSSAITWAKQKGVINGYTNGTFKPTKNVTREEMATMIYNFAKYKGLTLKASKDITQYKDYTKITPYARVPMKWAVSHGLMGGKDNGTRLDPLGNATRAECSKMLLQAYKLIYK